jgi:hypothetical protein
VALTVPSTGAPWSTSYLGSLRTNRVRRGGRVAVLVRDYAGPTTNISPTVFSPFAQDGQIRLDLLAAIPDPANAGSWIKNTASNQGWYLVGWLDPKGVDHMPDMSVDKLEGLQSNETLRSDIQKEGGSVSFTALESTGLTDALEYNLPLSAAVDDGATGYFVSKLADAALIERQLLVIRADATAGGAEYTAIPHPRVAVDKVNKRTWDKKAADSLDITFDDLLDPYFVDSLGRPLASGRARWRSGAGWLAAGGTPTFSSTAPVGAAVSGAKATVTVTEPTDYDPATVTYTVAQQVGGTGSYTSSALATGVNPTGVGTGTLVFTVTGLTPSSTYKFQIIATGSDGVAVVSAASNSITATS